MPKNDKKTKQIMSKKGSLKSLFPEIASEWHPEKNGDLKPENYSGKSTKKIWWLCSEGHAYDTSIKNRTSVLNTQPASSTTSIIINELL